VCLLDVDFVDNLGTAEVSAVAGDMIEIIHLVTGDVD